MAGRAVVGLDIGTSCVRAAELTLGRDGQYLQRFGQVTLPPGAVRDGEVSQPEVVAEALRELWHKTKFSRKKVVVGVANQRVIVRQVDLPWLPPAELRAALSYQVQDYIPMPVEQAILDFHPLEEFKGDGGTRMLRVLLVAAARDMVDGALDAVARAGLQPSMVDLNSFAVLRAVAHRGQALDEPVAEAVIDIGASVTNIIVHQAGVPRFVRILLLGGSDITDAVAERMGVSLEEAEQVKLSVGLPSSPGGPHPAARAIEAAGASFVEEVRGSLGYFMSQPGAMRVDRLVLSGGGSLLTGLAERLEAATHLPVERARPLALLGLGRTGLSEEQLAYVEPMTAVPVGLALGVAS